MRHRKSGKQLSRTTSHRRAMRRNMAVSLFAAGAIRTTEVKAKELRRFVERLITVAKEGTLHARRRVIAALGNDRMLVDDEGEPQDQTVVQKLFDEIAPRYADRPGGYTRLIRVSERRIGDAGQQVIMQLIEDKPGQSGGGTQATSRRRRRAAKRHEAAAGVGEAPVETAEAPQASEPAETAAEPADEQTEDKNE